jgi:hypothetical protein
MMTCMLLQSSTDKIHGQWCVATVLDADARARTHKHTQTFTHAHTHAYTHTRERERERERESLNLKHVCVRARARDYSAFKLFHHMFTRNSRRRNTPTDTFRSLERLRC